MSWLEASVLLLLYGTALVAGWAAALVWRRRAGAWAGPVVVLLLALIPWSLGQAMALQVETVAEKTFWELAQLPGIVTVPVAWFVLSLQQAGKQRWLRPRVLLLLSLPGILTMPLALAYSYTPLGRLIYTDVTLVRAGPFEAAVTGYGPWAWLHISYNAILLVGGSIWLYPALRERAAFDSRWGRAAALLAPWLHWPFFLLTRMGALALDLTPVVFMIGAGLLVLVMLRNPLADLVPVARRSVLAQMADGVLVVDVQARIAYANPAAEALLQRTSGALHGKTLEGALPAWREVWERARQDACLETEVTVEHPSGLRHVELRLSPLTNESGELCGQLVLWHDITARQTAAELLVRQAMFEKLLTVARATAMGVSLEETLQNALDVACKVTGAEMGSIFLLDDERRITSSILARGGVPPPGNLDLVMEHGLAGWAVRNRSIAVVADTAQDARWLELPDQPEECRSVLVAPITSGGRVPGVLTLQHSEPGHFGEGEVELMQAATHQMALALHNAQIFERQRTLALQQETVYDVLAMINERLAEPDVLDVVVQTIRERTGWPSVAILIAQGGELVVHASTGLLACMKGARLPDDAGHAGAAFTRGVTRLVRDVYHQPTYLPVEGLRSLVASPLRRQERLGVFLAGSDRPDAFGEQDLGMVELLAEALALGMTSTRLFRAVSDEQTRLEALIQASRDGIVLVGLDRRLLVINQRALDYVGLPGAPSDWVNVPLEKLQEALLDREPALAGLLIAETQRIARGDLDIGEGTGAANGRDLHWMNLPVSAGDAAVGRLIVLQDISRERELQRMRSDVTHMMVHDLRNPLNVVASGLEMARAGLRDVDQPKVKEILRIAGQSTERLLALVDDILHISRLEDGRLPLDLQLTSLGALVQDALEAERPLAEAKGLELVAHIQPDLPLAKADPWLLTRVLHNLVDNAIKFAPPGSPITVTVCRREGAFVVSVQDHGPGVAADMRERLFEKFASSDGHKRGTGLGLAFCRLAVEAHGGRIGERNANGDGAIFEFTLPLAVEPAPVEMRLPEVQSVI
ncbi:MAG: GAF domain-containing protein [Chloroflexi bacterium]|nr:GAF domain-containing protein [Chloroflexota bacterium]